MMHRYNNYLTDDDIFLNSPDVYDGKLTIKDSSNTVLGLFSANCSNSDVSGLMPLINPVIASGNLPAINLDGSLYDSGISLTQIMDAIAAGDAILQAQIDSLNAMLNISYTVTFDSNGGSTVADQSVAGGGKASGPGRRDQIGLHAGWLVHR